MHPADLVRRLNAGRDLQAEIQRLDQRQRATPGQSNREELSRDALGHGVDETIVGFVQLMNQNDIRMLDLVCRLRAWPPGCQLGTGAQEQDRDLDPARVLGTIVPADRGIPHQFSDADPGTEGTTQERIATGSRAPLVLRSAARTGRRCPSSHGRFGDRVKGLVRCKVLWAWKRGVRRAGTRGS
jgi:hypothetical protein